MVTETSVCHSHFREHRWGEKGGVTGTQESGEEGGTVMAAECTHFSTSLQDKKL